MKGSVTKSTAAMLALALGAALASPAAADLIVRFDQPHYELEPGQTLTVDIHYDADAGEPGETPWPAGLFGAALRVAGYEGYLAIDDVDNDVVLPAALDSDAFGTGPGLRELGPAGAFVRFRGEVDLFGGPGLPEPYDGTYLGSIAFQVLEQVGQFSLELGPFGDAAADFVDGQDQDIDEQVSFTSSTVNVVPEPASVALLGAGLVLLGRRGRRNRATSG